ncbi:hypothetical protein PR048_018881 [Dryococelus australis]|uniref:Uncharacterized protein n=1 Tax=Dryococelus australis TaxID=614101 RepID=A0ABQ9H223_9NEOP|nr:hypothetical protein PR048_018881 [Dryococelus australis]
MAISLEWTYPSSGCQIPEKTSQPAVSSSAIPPCDNPGATPQVGGEKVVSYSAPTETAHRPVSFRPPPVSPPPPEQTRDRDSHESSRVTRRRRARTQLTSLSAGPPWHPTVEWPRPRTRRPPAPSLSVLFYFVLFIFSPLPLFCSNLSILQDIEVPLLDTQAFVPRRTKEWNSASTPSLFFLHIDINQHIITNHIFPSFRFSSPQFLLFFFHPFQIWPFFFSFFLLLLFFFSLLLFFYFPSLFSSPFSFVFFLTARLPPRRIWFDYRRGRLRISACGNRAGRCRWSAGFFGDLPLHPPHNSGAAPYSPHFTLISSQDLDVKNQPNLFTHSNNNSTGILRVSPEEVSEVQGKQGKGRRVHIVGRRGNKHSSYWSIGCLKGGGVLASTRHRSGGGRVFQFSEGLFAQPIPFLQREQRGCHPSPPLKPFSSAGLWRSEMFTVTPGWRAAPLIPRRRATNQFRPRDKRYVRLARKRNIPEKSRWPATSSGTIATCEGPVTRPGIEPGSPWWEAGRLIAQPLSPQLTPALYLVDTHRCFEGPLWVKRGEYGAAPECKGGGNGRSPRKPAATDIMWHDSHVQMRNPGANPARLFCTSVSSKVVAASQEDVFLACGIITHITEGQAGATMAKVVRLLASHQGELGSIPRPVHFPDFRKGYRAVQCCWTAGFLGDLPFPQALHSTAAPYSPRFTLIGSQDINRGRNEVRMEERRKQGRLKREIPEKTRQPAASSGTIPTCKNTGVSQPGIEPCSYWWEASISLLAFHQCEPGSIPGQVTGFSHVGIVPDDAAGRRVFSGISRFPSPPRSGTAPLTQSSSSALMTSMPEPP